MVLAHTPFIVEAAHRLLRNARRPGEAGAAPGGGCREEQMEKEKQTVRACGSGSLRELGV